MSRSSDVNEKLKMFEARFKERLSEDIDTINSLDNITEIETLRNISHKLAGSAGTFGFDELSAEMKEFELKLFELKQQGISGDTYAELCNEACEIINKVLKA